MANIERIRKQAATAWVVALSALVPASVLADPLTCAEFRQRLDGTLMADGVAAEAPAYRDTAAAADGSRRVPWRTTSLDGSMSCGAGDAFREFYVNLSIASKERFLDQLKQFIATNGAAICAAVEGVPAACMDAGKALLQTGLREMGAAYQKKVSAPSGVATRLLADHLKAELTAAPTLVTFTLDVDGAPSIDEARPALLPPPAPSQP